MDVQAQAAGMRRLVHEFNNLWLVIGGHCESISAAGDVQRTTRPHMAHDVVAG
jgi:hypothetical protein